MHRIIVFCLVCLIVAPLRASAGTNESATVEPSSSAALPFGLASLPQLDQKSWQEEYDAAKSKKSRGRMLMWIGAGVTGLGVVMITKVSGDCARFGGGSVCEDDFGVPVLMTSSGAGLLVGGIMQQRDASRTIGELERQRKTWMRTEMPIVVAGGTSVFAGEGGVTVRHTVNW